MAMKLRKMFNKRQRYYSTGGDTVIAVGDVHGMIGCMNVLMRAIESHPRAHTAQYVFLGDYIDRGPHSAMVIERLIQMQCYMDLVCLAGNHERALLDFIDGLLSYKEYVRWGGRTTLRSYGVLCDDEDDPDAQEAARVAMQTWLPAHHERFLRGLPLYHTVGDYIFVHAGLRPKRSLEEQTADDLLMIRDDFIGKPITVEQRIIHGHTISETPNIREGAIGIDTGAYDSHILTAIVICDNDYSFVTSADVLSERPV